MIREAINELKKYTLGKKNTEKVEISVLKLNRVIKALEQESCEDCISRQSLLDKAFEIKTGEYTSAMVVYAHDIRTLPPVKPKANVDALINKIETDLSSSMYDDWGNSTDLHNGLVDIIRKWAERNCEENEANRC